MDKKTKKSMDKSMDVLKRLIKEQEKAKSTTLKNLLAGEIEAYFALGQSLNNCVNILDKAQAIFHHNISDSCSLAQHLTNRAEEIKSTNAYGDAHRVLTELKDFIDLLQHENNVQIKCLNISVACCELFSNATQRNPAKWSKMVAEIAAIWAAFILGYVPNISTITDIGFNIGDTLKTVKKYTQEVPNYKAMDRGISLIEKHTEIMKTVTSFFNHITAEVSTFVKTN